MGHLESRGLGEDWAKLGNRGTKIAIKTSKKSKLE
jgi:hypothetical protein